MGLFHISGIRLNIPWRCSTPINCPLIRVCCYYTMTSVSYNCGLCHAVVTECFYLLWREQFGTNFPMHWFVQSLRQYSIWEFFWWMASYSHMDSENPFQSLNAASDSQHPVQRAQVLQPNDWDLTGFRKPVSIFCQHFLCCAKTVCSQRQRNVQIKACYPLLRGRMHIMVKGMALISICERITPCCGERKFILFPLLFLFLLISYKICSDQSLVTETTLKQVLAFTHVGAVKTLSYWFIYLFICFYHSWLTLKIERLFF